MKIGNEKILEIVTEVVTRNGGQVETNELVGTVITVQPQSLFSDVIGYNPVNINIAFEAPYVKIGTTSSVYDIENAKEYLRCLSNAVKIVREVETALIYAVKEATESG